MHTAARFLDRYDGNAAAFISASLSSCGSFPLHPANANQSSGVNINEDSVKAFFDLKLKKKYKYISYKISGDNTDIIIEDAVEKCTYDEFVDSLPEDECRYYIFDFEYDFNRGEGPRSKILLLVWYVAQFSAAVLLICECRAPECAKTKNKMLYAASKAVLKKKFEGIFAEVQCTDTSEASYDYVLDKIGRVAGG